MTTLKNPLPHSKICLSNRFKKSFLDLPVKTGGINKRVILALECSMRKEINTPNNFFTGASVENPFLVYA